MKTFTNCAEKKAKQFLNLLQGYTKGIRMTAILVLLLMGVSNAWAWNVEEGKVYYFKPSTVWKSDNARFAIAFGSGDNTYAWQSCVAVSGETDTYYVTSPGNYDWMIFVRMNPANNTNDWSNKWNESQRVQPNNNFNKFELKADWATDFNWYKFAPPMKSVTISNDGSTVYGGDGTSNNPYQIKKGATISVQASATSSVPNDPQTKYYRFYKKENSGTRSAIGNESTTTTSSFTASSTVGTKYEVDVEARNEYYSTYGTKATSSKLYFVTIEPIYAILGSFNNWTHSANTWDLSDQGSNTWKATFHLEQGNHTFKVVHNSSYYGKNSATITRSSATASSLSTSGADINLTADYAGNYTFTFNSSTKNLTVTYPTIYKVTYSHVPAAAADAPTTNPSVTSGNSVVAGTSVTFTAKTAKTGYTWKGWYSNNAGTGDALSTNLAYTRSITDNTTIYAVYTPKTYTITLNPQGGKDGTASVTATYNSNILEPKITNPTKHGYRFKGWFTNASSDVMVINTEGNLVPNAKTGIATYTDENGNWIKDLDNIPFHAQWTPEIFYITYKDQGDKEFSGTHAAHYPTTHTYGIETTLKSATKPGYTFDGWYTTSDCTGSPVNSLAKTYSANITLYAKWTIKQYTLDFGAGEGGSVTATAGGKPITSPATLDHNTSITLTATPEGENAFAQWINEGGVKVSTANPYTFTITSNTTLKAEFSKPTTVYLKPSSAWKEYNAHFAIYAWGKTNSWVEMEAVDCEGDYYRANVPAGFSDFAFVRLKPDGYSSVNGGHNWDNKWDQTGNLSVQTNGKNMYDIDDKTVSYIHLKPNNNWKSDEARFAAYFFGNGDKWVNLTKNGDVYTCKKPAGYTSVIFCRMKPGTSNGWGDDQCWNKTKDLTILNDGSNCFSINQDDWGCSGSGDGNANGANGEWFRVLDDSQWKTYSAPTYNVTIKPTIHGTYSVVCNGRTYLAPNKEEIVIPNVPVGTTLTIQDVKPNNETEYTSNIIYKESANAAYQTLEGNQITVCGNTTIDENFVTKNAHVVYLRIPSSIAWGTDNYQKLSVYNKLTGSYTPTAMTAAAGSYESGYTYYTCTIPASTHTIRFEYINGNTKYQSHDFPHVMPLGSLNCYTIHSKEGETSVFNGYWSELLSAGDYRLLYVEQVVEKGTGENSWKTVITRKKAHPSDIIPQGIITEGGSKVVSLHIFKDRTYTANAGGGKTYESSNNPEVILQQYNGTTWENKERHMVFGPLKTLPGMAMAPGRRNAVANAELVYDDGIENIKNDNHVDQGSGVWNFTVTQSNGGESATIDLTQTRRYNEETDGPYYIRTDVANGNWYNYTNPDNHMTRSDISKQHSNYSHYFCKWVESENNVNVKFTIANKYGYAISDTLEADRTDLWGVELTEAQKMLKDQTLPENANVRFTWNEKSNLIHRAYIAGSADVQDRFLVLRGKGDSKLFNAAGEALTEGQAQTSRYGLHANEEIFSDIENWVYQTDVQMIPGAELQVTADYNEKVQYFVGKEGIFNNTILQGSSNEKYLVRLLYDFKTNELISAYVPGASKDVDQISTNLMIIRQNYGEAKQLVFNNGDMSTRENRRAYGVIEFTENYLKDGSIPDLKRCLYWVSFPFDVNLSEAFGSLVYGKHWLIQEYDGARRAAEGLWKESESFWKLHWEPNITLEAGLGYVIEIDINQMIKDNIIDPTDDKQQIAALYFPSNTPITTEIINRDTYTVNIPAHKCEIVHTGTYGDRTIRDSHWNVIGVPSYINTGATFSDQRYALNNVVKYYYQWDGEVDKYTAMEAKEQAYSFHSMYAYMVQYAGDITWNSVLLDEKPAQIAAKKNSVTNEHAMRLELQQNNILLDKTFVRLQDDVATPAFDFNYDLCKITNKGANIYSIITAEASPVDVAANVLPIEETIIPIGIKTDAAGDYTFAMPDGTDGIVVELIDYETNTRTNMLLDEYTINLGNGTFENRFALHVKPNKTTTSIVDVNTNSNGVRKFIIDGTLYMQKDGVLYDAQGRCVQ